MGRRRGGRATHKEYLTWPVGAAGSLRAGARGEGKDRRAGELCLNWHQAQTEEASSASASAALIFPTDNTTTVSHLALGDPSTAWGQSGERVKRDFLR